MFVFVALGCQSKKVEKTDNAISSDYFVQDGFKQITFLGENDSPRFSPEGRKLIFISRGRPRHQHPQVYEINLSLNTERRVTFNDGTDFSPSYMNEEEIMYASNTDEIKESLFLNKQPPMEYPTTEIYQSDLFGNEIVRWTQYPGFDGYAAFAASGGPRIFFSSLRGGILGIMKLDLKDKQISFVNAEKDKQKLFPNFQNDRLVWIEKDLKSNKTSIQFLNYARKKPAVETLKEEEGAEYQDLFWRPGSASLFYSVRRKGDKVFNLEVYDFEKKCTQSLFKGKESLFQPVVSVPTSFWNIEHPSQAPSRSSRTPKIAFVRAFQDKKQIYMADLPDNLGPCAEQATSAKLSL